MSLRRGNYLILTARGNVYGGYEGLPAAKGIRTRKFKGKGDIYQVVTVDRSIDASWEPVLELVDAGL